MASTLVPNEEGTKANLYATIGPDAAGGIVLSDHTDVVRVLGLLQQELRAVMMQIGAPSLKDIVPAMVRRA